MAEKRISDVLVKPDVALEMTLRPSLFSEFTGQARVKERLEITVAAAKKRGEPIDHVLLFCYQYDPSAATYSAAILRIIRLGGILTVLCIVAGILISYHRETLAAARNLRQQLSSGVERGAH